MEKLQLPNVTLIGIDCIDARRLLKAFAICEKYAQFGAKKLLTTAQVHTTSDVHIIRIKDIRSKEEYSCFVMKELNDYVDTDFALIVQHDGFITNPAAWSDDFLQYDYIGAPWWHDDEYNVGNGGFSLRSKKLLELLQKDTSVIPLHPEDHHICRTYGPYLRSKGIKFAPEHMAAQFSIEGHKDPQRARKYGNTWNGQFGFHGLQKNLDLSKWHEYREFQEKQ